MLVYMITLILKSHKRAEKGKSCLVHIQIKPPAVQAKRKPTTAREIKKKLLSQQDVN